MDHRNYGRLAIMIDKTKFKQLFEDWNASIDWERKHGHYGENTKKQESEPNVEIFKPIVQRWIVNYAKTKDWEPENPFFTKILEMSDSKQRLECLLENISVPADESHILCVYLISVFVESEGLWNGKKVVLLNVVPKFKRRGIYFSGHYANDTEKQNIKIPAHLVTLSQGSSLSQQNMTKALLDYTLWRENATIVTGALLKDALQDILGITAAWSKHPKMNLNLDLNFLDEEEVEGEDEEGQRHLPGNEEESEEDENFGDVDFMSTEPPITIAVPPTMNQGYKRKEPDGGGKQPQAKKPRQ